MSWIDLLPEPRGKRFARAIHWARTNRDAFLREFAGDKYEDD